MSDATAPPPLVNGLPPIPPNIAQITAPLLFGIMIGWALYGVLCVQVYMYHLCFKDKKTIQVLVYGVFFLDTLQTIFTGVDAWYWFCEGYGNLIKLSNPYISAFDTPMMGSLIELIVQLFFCYRIFVLGQSPWLPGFIGMVSLMQCVAAFISGIRGHIVGNFAAARLHIDLVALYIWLIASAVADTLIACAMTVLLMRSKQEHKSTNRILSKLVRLTVETNVASALLALLSLILYFGIPNTSYFISPTFFLGKVFSNTLLVTLNNRYFLSREKENMSGYTANASSSWHARTKESEATHVAIRSTTTTVTDNSPTSKQHEIELDRYRPGVSKATPV